MMRSFPKKWYAAIFSVVLLSVFCLGCAAGENEATMNENEGTSAFPDTIRMDDESTINRNEGTNAFPDKILIDVEWYNKLIGGYQDVQGSSFSQYSTDSFEFTLDNYALFKQISRPHFTSMEVVDITEDMWEPHEQFPELPIFFRGKRGLQCKDSEGNLYLVMNSFYGEAVFCNGKREYFALYLKDLPYDGWEPNGETSSFDRINGVE